jgi:ABC-type multidrug transport system fused ATPase/permease subunit
MLRKIFNYCRITIRSSPLAFSFNIFFIMLIAVAIFMMSYSGKLLVNSIIAAQKSQVFNFAVIVPSLVYFAAITLGGNYFNFQDMLISIYTKKSRKLFSKMFLYKSFKTRQDKFYDNNFYNDYEFVKKNIGSTTDLTVSIFNNFAGSLFSIILSVTAMAVFDPVILICILVLMVCLTFLNKYLVKKRVTLNEKYVGDERKADYFRSLLSERSHVRELRIFKLRNHFIKMWEESYRKYSIGKFRFEIKATLLGSIIGLLRIIMERGIDLYFIYMVFMGRINAGDCVFLIGITGALGRGITNIINILSSEINEKYRYVDKYHEFAGDINIQDVKKSEQDKSGVNSLCCGDFRELRLDNVSYRYPHSEGDNLKNISFRLKKGEVVSILGYNGSGKSTLSKVMCGLLEDYSGKIRINGVDISTLEREELYKYFGIAFQDFSRYSISLKENVGVGMVEKLNDDIELSKAMKKGNINAVIQRLPNGENTILGKEYDSEGQDLSGGQWQRIILSRAYMGEPEILILDEPTAAIDPIEEMRMLNDFKNIIHGKTAILISHRIGFARLSSRICIMEGGQIVEEGSHEELMKLKGRYYELFTSQKELYEEKVS